MRGLLRAEGRSVPTEPDVAAGARPVRVKLSRAKGWRMPPNTVVVARPSKWGNPYRLDADHQPWSRHPWGSAERAQACVDYYRRAAVEWLCVPYTKVPRPGSGSGAYSFGAHRVAEAAPHELRGKNLACWCALDAPCHADVLLELANAEATPAVSQAQTGNAAAEPRSLLKNPHPEKETG